MPCQVLPHLTRLPKRPELEADMAINILALLEKKPEKIDYVLPSLVAGTVGALVSPGGAGKSALALQIAAQVAGGPDLIDFGSKKVGLSAYMPGEDPEIIIQHRLYALLEHCSPEHRQLMHENLLIEPLIDHNVNILEDQWFNYFLIVAKNRRLMIFDTLRMVHDEDENDSGAMKRVVGKFRQIASQTGCAIIFLHHTNKLSSFTGSGAEQGASRGSSVLVDNIRWQGYMRSMSEKECEDNGVDPEMKGYFVEFGISKQNYGAPFFPKWLRKVSCSDPDIEGGYVLKPALLEKNKKQNNTTGRNYATY